MATPSPGRGNTLNHRIFGNEQIARAINRNTCRLIQQQTASTRDSHNRPGRGDLPHSIVERVGDKDIARRVHRKTHRAIQHRLSGLPVISRVACGSIASERRNDAIRRNLPDHRISGIQNEDISRSIDRRADRSRDLSAQATAIPGITRIAVARDSQWPSQFR